MIWLTVDPHGMAKKGEAGPRHLCDNCSDGCKVLHVVVMEACSAKRDMRGSLRVTRRKMSRSAMARQVKSHQVKGWGEKGRHLEWNAPPRLVMRVTLSHVPALSSQPWSRRHLATPVNVFQQKFTVDLYCIFNCCTRHTWWTASPSFCSKATPRKIKCHLNTQYHQNNIILIILTHLPPLLHPYLHTDAIFQAAGSQPHLQS